MKRVVLSLCCLAPLGSAACTGDDGVDEPDFGIDEDAIVAAALEYKSMERIHELPVESQHLDATTVVSWVPAAHADRYRSVDPDDPESTIEPFPVGALIVKEQRDPDQKTTLLTVMFKAEAGYAPDGGDWWWGSITPGGELKAGGHLAPCTDCHGPRDGADWVFGVAADNQL